MMADENTTPEQIADQPGPVERLCLERFEHCHYCRCHRGPIPGGYGGIQLLSEPDLLGRCPRQASAKGFQGTFGEFLIGRRAGDLVIKRAVIVRCGRDAAGCQPPQGLTCDFRGLGNLSHEWVSFAVN